MLKIENLHKSYGKKEILKGLTLNIEDGDIVALIGVNGAGKSTMLEIICGLIKKNSGSVEIANMNIDKRGNRKKIKYILGYMPQYFSMFNDLTVKENLKYLCTVYGIKDKNRCQDIIKLCNLEDKQNQLAKNLSGGYRQLLSLAGTIINLPKFLIMDEPTSAMDPIFRSKFWDIIKKLNSDGTTILVTTHYIEEIIECNKMFCLSNGVITIEKDTKELEIENKKYKNIFDMYTQKE